jgi:hypothetical protein
MQHLHSLGNCRASFPRVFVVSRGFEKVVKHCGRPHERSLAVGRNPDNNLTQQLQMEQQYRTSG